MPIQAFNCEICDEELEFVLTVHDDVDKQECPICLSPLEWLPCLTAMHPDNMWAGRSTDYGNFSSKSRYMKVLKENNIEITTSRSERERIASKALRVKEEKRVQADQAIEHTVAETLRGVEFPDAGYNSPTVL